MYVLSVEDNGKEPEDKDVTLHRPDEEGTGNPDGEFVDGLGVGGEEGNRNDEDDNLEDGDGDILDADTWSEASDDLEQVSDGVDGVGQYY